MTDYLRFLRTKIVQAPETGFAVEPGNINKALKPHQRDAVVWAVAGGRRGYTIELNNGYFRDAVGYLKGYEDEKAGQFSLFDVI